MGAPGKKSTARLLPVLLLILTLLAVGSSFCFWLAWGDTVDIMLQAGDISTVGPALVKDLEGRRIDYVPLEKMPKHLIQAIIAMEDARFFDHKGVDFLGIARAMVVNLHSGKVLQGGSTITQQLAKNLYLDHSRTIQRKLLETRIALALEKKFSKELILEMYLNQIYFGEGNYGIGRAAAHYFNKEVADLSLGEAAALVGIVQAPNAYSPSAAGWEAVFARQKLVLQRMIELEMVTEEEAREATLLALEYHP
ncbi:MAG: biosynthetic peptidoglycan transglycosylase [Dethiobacteria bacterium]|nr:transglycosylase domain-containing protein [Bacillota bacterium]HPT33194.1 biosynthetic peptidoglycan transglycosylase [Bacillota bacterium]HQD05940.1 biosynthetic peptidoglycan transglycosylase [Bacillota bacterium]